VNITNLNIRLKAAILSDFVYLQHLSYANACLAHQATLWTKRVLLFCLKMWRHLFFCVIGC